ncbi:MAG: hypothetical protein LUD02_01690 [Tannerellaceae bacterium]|nr:hypothetical protein [Tannerellaceae bacterium]MCD8263009.1 hypothetical protein [Tannerellaceae bacterium]
MRNLAIDIHNLSLTNANTPMKQFNKIIPKGNKSNSPADEPKAIPWVVYGSIIQP